MCHYKHNFDNASYFIATKALCVLILDCRFIIKAQEHIKLIISNIPYQENVLKYIDSDTGEITALAVSRGE